jgi:DNA-binding transcriptional LysR family regulator
MNKSHIAVRRRAIIVRILTPEFVSDEQSQMDTVDSMRVFVRIVERRSFTAAAADLGVPRSTVTETIKQLETRLGVRLLQRTTRHVAPTPEGDAYYQRCLAILADIEEAENSFSEKIVRGVLRVDVHGNMARLLLLPHLPDFLARYPDLALHIGEGDRLVDLVREGIDCVVRAGEPPDSGMIIRRLGQFEEVTVASPEYLKKHGVPASPDDLDGHVMIGFVSSRTGKMLPLEFTQGGKIREVTLPARITVTSSDTSAALARLGFGLTQAPKHRFDADLASGALVEVLAKFPPSPTLLSALYPHSRQLSPRVRVFVDWLVSILAKQSSATARHGKGGSKSKG